MQPIHLIGMPLDLGASRRGVDMGPSAFRIASLGDRLAALHYAVVDKGNLSSPIRETRRPGDPRKKYVREIARACQRLYHASQVTFRAGALPVVLGGDHSLAAGSVAAAAAYARRQRKPLGLL